MHRHLVLLLGLAACSEPTSDSDSPSGDTDTGSPVGSADCTARQQIDSTDVLRDGSVDWGGRAAVQPVTFTTTSNGGTYQHSGSLLWSDRVQQDLGTFSAQFSATWTGETGGHGPGDYTIVPSLSDGVIVAFLVAEPDGAGPNTPYTASGGTLTVAEYDVADDPTHLCRVVSFAGVTFDQQNGDAQVTADAVLLGLTLR